MWLDVRNQQHFSTEMSTLASFVVFSILSISLIYFKFSFSHQLTSLSPTTTGSLDAAEFFRALGMGVGEGKTLGIPLALRGVHGQPQVGQALLLIP